jgi:iron complex transport system permease protein
VSAVPSARVRATRTSSRAAIDRAIGRTRTRTRRVVVGLAAAVVVAVVVSTALGDFLVPLGRIVPAILGEGDEGAVFIVRSIRFPRVLVGLLVGVALGYSGSIFQSMVRNPLASPDILGVTAGASAAAVFLITNRSLPWYEVDAAGGVPAVLPLVAFLGAAATAGAMYLLAFKGGRVSSGRLVLIGIAVGETLLALTAFMLSRSQLLEAAYGELWLTGSLNARGWESVVPLAVCLVGLLPLAHVLSRPLTALQLGDDLSGGIGVRVQGSKLALLGVGVALAGVAVAAAGPVAFVAFMAGPIARRLSGTSAPALLEAGLVGGVIVVVADLLGRVALSSTEIPVGIVTSVVGVPFLIWIIVRRNAVGVGS